MWFIWLIVGLFILGGLQKGRWWVWLIFVLIVITIIGIVITIIGEIIERVEQKKKQIEKEEKNQKNTGKEPDQIIKEVISLGLASNSEASSCIIKKKPKSQINFTKIIDASANNLLNETFEIKNFPEKGKNTKPAKIKIDTNVIRQNVVKNKNKLMEIPLFSNYVFHITHIDNLRSILKSGLLSHDNPYKKIDISDQDVNRNRDKTEVVYGNNLHNYVPFYFNCRNAMLYKTQKEFGKNIIILLFEKNIMLEDGVIFTNKNAATSDVKFTNDIEGLLDNGFINWDNVNKTRWEKDGVVNVDVKRTMMAEVLALNEVDVNKIHTICCQTNYIKDFITNCFAINNSKINVCRTDKYFF